MTATDRGDLSMCEEVVLLGIAGPRRRLRLALEAACRADGRRMGLRQALRRLQRRGLVRRAGWRRWEALDTPELASVRFRVGATVWRPRTAAPRDVDLAVLALAVGALTTGQRRSARGLLVGLAARPPATTWLMDVRGIGSTTELADRLLRDTAAAPTFEDGAFDPGISSGVEWGY
jgi:hypothetical protein